MQIVWSLCFIKCDALKSLNLRHFLQIGPSHVVDKHCRFTTKQTRWNLWECDTATDSNHLEDVFQISITLIWNKQLATNLKYDIYGKVIALYESIRHQGKFSDSR